LQGFEHFRGTDLWSLKNKFHYLCAFAPLRAMVFLIQAAVLAKAQRPLRRNAHYYGAI
jgi:hypothetical protein